LVSSVSSFERWYVAHTLPRQEAKAEFHLKRQDFQTYLPRLKRTVRHARKTRTVYIPAFSRYIFVRMDIGRARWRSINGTIGVANLITADAMPRPVPDGIVENLLDYTDVTGLLSFDRDLRPGQSVRLITGPLAQAIGQLESLDAKGRVRVLLDFMGGKVQMHLQQSALEAA
jgi:transcriptional antiterminator RfaH